MNRIENEEFIIGSISLLANKLNIFGDKLLPDITYKQWFLLMMISKITTKEKNINNIAEFVGTSRQNVKKILKLLEDKDYIAICKSKTDGRALEVELTEKAYKYFDDNDAPTVYETSRLFSDFSDNEIDDFVIKLQKLLLCLEKYKERDKSNED